MDRIVGDEEKKHLEDRFRFGRPQVRNCNGLHCIS
jgi:hypothetical protein